MYLARGFRVWGLRVGDQHFKGGGRVQGLTFRVCGLVLRVQCLVFQVKGVGCARRVGRVSRNPPRDGGFHSSQRTHFERPLYQGT